MKVPCVSPRILCLGSMFALAIHFAAPLKAANIEASRSSAAQHFPGPARFKEVPGDYALPVGKPYTLTLKGIGTDPLRYTWTRNGVALANEDATLTIDPATLSGTEPFTVTVANSQGQEKATFTVRAYTEPPPAFIEVSGSQSIPIGEAVDLTAISLSQGVTERWFRNGQPLNFDEHAQKIASMVESVGPVTYTARAEGIGGTSTSHPIKVTGIPSREPAFTIHPTNGNVEPGSTFFFTAPFSVTPDAREWYRDGVKLSNSSTALGADLFVFNATPADAGKYTCQVTWHGKTYVSGAGRLTVKPATEVLIAESTGNVTERTGHDIALKVFLANDSPATFAWSKDGVAIPGANQAVLVVPLASRSDFGKYEATVTQGSRAETTVPMVISQRDVGEKPIISSHPSHFVDLGDIAGQPVKFQTGYYGEAPVHFQWFKDGAAIAGSDSNSLQITRGAAATGRYAVTVTNVNGSVTSEEGSYTWSPEAQPPRLISSPRLIRRQNTMDVEIFVPDFASLSPIVYELVQDGTAQGKTSLPSFFLGTTPATFQCRATNSAGSTLTPTFRFEDAFFTAADASDTKLMNLATRAQVGSGEKALIVGFVITGTGTKDVLLRGVADSLAKFSLGGLLPNPKLSLYRGSTLLMQNDDWSSQSASLKKTMLDAGAFSLLENSHDAVLLPKLEPGSYTAVITDESGGAGLALVEAYVLAGDSTPTRLTNLATRGYIGPNGDVMIAGVVIRGSQPKRLLIRGVGPTLASYGISNYIADPLIKLYQGSRVIAESDNIGSEIMGQDFESTSYAAGAFGIVAPEAALLLYLEPGDYTVHLSSKDGAPGIGLLEIYEIN